MQEFQRIKAQAPNTSIDSLAIAECILPSRQPTSKQKVCANIVRLGFVAEQDLPLLKQWRSSKSKNRWDKAVALLDRNEGLKIKAIATKIERHPDSVNKWIRNYKSRGLHFMLKRRVPNAAILEHMKNKKRNLMTLIHQTPDLLGINRTSWSLKTLVKAYRAQYGEKISKSSVSEYINEAGYSFKKAREVLTSPDPDYMQKLAKIKQILSALGPKEKFFSIDEYGPFSIKMKGGRSLAKKGELKTFPQFQKSKGFLICTAALELSTNQVLHFYSRKKNTDEMITLLDLILKEYCNEERIFLSWDAASWHASKALYAKIEQHNKPENRFENKTPVVELAPLPASAQFLNVIESVFSGLAKNVIHNSNYQSVDEAKRAIDLYFFDRNAHYKQNPKRAGNSIWRLERVEPFFDEANNCKDPAWR
jgi:transposase